MKHLNINIIVRSCQECVYCVEGANDYICNNEKTMGNISINNPGEINTNCPLKNTIDGIDYNALTKAAKSLGMI